MLTVILVVVAAIVLFAILRAVFSGPRNYYPTQPMPTYVEPDVYVEPDPIGTIAAVAAAEVVGDVVMGAVDSFASGPPDPGFDPGFDQGGGFDGGGFDGGGFDGGDSF